MDAHGLDEMDNKILTTIIEKFKGGPVGLTTLTPYQRVAKQLRKCNDVLIQEGFIMRTPRGREVTDKAYKHLGKYKHSRFILIFSRAISLFAIFRSLKKTRGKDFTIRGYRLLTT
jgi:hypothetical protein